MPKNPTCECGYCRTCKQRECQRAIRSNRAKYKDVIWPDDEWGRSAREAAMQLMSYSCALKDMEALRFVIRTGRSARKSAAE